MFNSGTRRNIMQNEKVVVDLDHPVWLSEPGFTQMEALGRYCALGKACIAMGQKVPTYLFINEYIY